MSALEILRMTLSRLIDPFSLLLLAILVISLFSAFRFKFRHPGTNLVFGFASLLYFFSLPIMSTQIIKKWEQDIQIFQGTDTKIDYILVLGCGHIEDENLPLSNQLSTCSLRRLAEGIFVQKSLGNVPMLFTGGKGWNTASHASVMGKVARKLGVPAELIIELEVGHTTLQEAEALQSTIANKSIILVTSASHMKRATEVISQTHPKEIISAPTNFYGLKPNPIMLLNFIPSLNNLAIVAKFTHEEIGRFYSIVMN
jgi:uncharacterized SAM-binding protein YcdF (DUF218 family)